MPRYVLDTSALLCYLRDEAGADQVFDILSSKSSDTRMHRVNLGEIYYGILRKDGERKANEVYGFLVQYPVHYLEDLSDPFLVTVGRLKVHYGLGFADSFAAAAAVLNNAILVTKDNDFRPLEKKRIIKIRWV